MGLLYVSMSLIIPSNKLEFARSSTFKCFILEVKEIFFVWVQAHASRVALMTWKPHNTDVRL